jgi:hypothetical protein
MYPKVGIWVSIQRFQNNIVDGFLIGCSTIQLLESKTIWDTDPKCLLASLGIVKQIFRCADFSGLCTGPQLTIASQMLAHLSTPSTQEFHMTLS